MSTPSVAQLKHAIAIAEQIEFLRGRLNEIMGGVPACVVVAAMPAAKKGRKRTMSPEGRERVGAAQRARWAKSKGTSKAAVKPAPTGKKFFSAETRAKMLAAALARYAKKNASVSAVAVPTRKKKRVLSPEGRARIVAALKARHAGNRMRKE